MKNNSFKRSLHHPQTDLTMKNIFFIASMVISIAIRSQSLINIIESPACDHSCTGNAKIKIHPDLLDHDMLPPFEVYLVNVSTQESASYTINGYQGVLPGLCPGDYEITVHLSEFCVWGGNIHIQSVLEIPLNINLNYQCNTGCINLNISEGTSPYEVTWLRKQGAEFIILPGWPKTNLNGNDGLEDLCVINEKGLYKVIVHDVQCGTFEQDILVNPCECLDIVLSGNKNLTYCDVPDANPPVPPVQSCDGSLSIEITAGTSYTILWSNGATTASITDLCSSIYTVTVTTPYCSKVISYEVCCCNFSSVYHDPGSLLLCSADGTVPAFDIILSGINPSGGEDNGSVLMAISGGATTKSFRWSGPNGFISSAQNITDLGPGLYSVTATDGCSKISKSMTLYECASVVFNPVSTIYNSCTGSNNGEIILTLPSSVSVVWQTNPVQTSHHIKNLSPGTYCVLLTDTNSGCSKEYCYTVENASSNYNIQIVEANPTCESSKTGKITLSIPNTKQPYYFYNVFNSITNQVVSSGYMPVTNNASFLTLALHNLDRGNYNLILLDRCSIHTISFDISTYTLEVEANVTLGCENDSSIELMVSGDNPPFTYRWNNGLPPLSAHKDLKRSVYSVTVTDSKGCQKTIEINDLKPAIEIVEKNPACTGMWDGSITLSINNPNHEEIRPYYSFGPCPDCPVFPISINNNTNNPVVFTMPDLSGKEEYTIGVVIGNCFYNFKFKVGEEKSSRQFNKFRDLGNDKIMCIYDEKCKDNIWPENLSSPARLQAEKGKCSGAPAGLLGLFSNCGTQDFFCDSVKVRSKKVGTRFLRVGQWIEWMTVTGKADLIPWHVLGDYCHYISVCENMPECLFGGGRWSLTGGHKVDEIKLPNGCIKVICASDFFLQPAPDYVICGLDFLPDYIPFSTQPDLPDRRCNTTTKNMAEMVYFLDELVQYYGHDFKNSSLYRTLKFYENDIRLNCAQITFCVCADGSDCIDKYRFESTDIEDIICYHIEPPIDSGSGLIGETCTAYFEEDGDFAYVWCTKGCPDGAIRSSCTKIKKLNYDFSKFKLTRFNDDPSTVIFRSNEVSKFERFSFSKLTPEVIYTDGIFSTVNNEHFYHNVYNEDWTINASNRSDFVYQDFTTNEGLLIKRNLQNGYTVLSTSDLQNPINININTIVGVENQHINITNPTRSFNISDLRMYQNSYLLTGNTDTILFHILLDRTNHISKTETITGFVDSSYAVTGKGFSSFVTRIPGNKIYLNNTEIITKYLQKISVIKFKDTYNGSVDISETISWLRPNKLIKVEENFETNAETYIFKGFGGIDFNGTFIPESNVEMIYVIHEERGNIFWKLFPVTDVLDTTYISLSSDKNGNIYLGMNYKGNLKTSEIDIHSKGEYDIVLLKYKNDGTFLGYKSYGSEESEILKDIYCGDYAIHLGGDIEGNILHRKIGDLTFAKLDTIASHAFISFTGMDDFVTANTQLRSSSVKRANLIEFSLIPNPTSSYIELKLNQALHSPMAVVIESMDGRIIFSTYLLKNQFSNDTFVLNTSDLPSGVYILKLNAENGVIGTKKFVKI